MLEGKLSENDLVYLAKLSEQAERYDEMADFMKSLVTNCLNDGDKKLTIEERNLLSVAYKNAVGGRRASWRIITSVEQREKLKATPEILNIIKEARFKVEAELDKICTDILYLLDNYLLNKANLDAESSVFYYKMKGDYYRYICEYSVDQKNAESVELARQAYVDAENIAFENLSCTHPIRLGLVLNYSVFLYEIIGSIKNAIEEAKNAFEAALVEFDQVNEDTYKDSTLIMQLLRDNMTLWTSDLKQQEQNEEEDKISQNNEKEEDTHNKFVQKNTTEGRSNEVDINAKKECEEE